MLKFLKNLFTGNSIENRKMKAQNDYLRSIIEQSIAAEKELVNKRKTLEAAARGDILSAERNYKLMKEAEEAKVAASKRASVAFKDAYRLQMYEKLFGRDELTR